MGTLNRHSSGLQDSITRSEKIVLVADVVESVLLMERDEDDAVLRWLRFLERAREIVTVHGGRMRKTTGDGLIAEMRDSVSAVRAAFDLHDAIETEIDTPASSQPMRLRCMVDRVSIFDMGDDIYGRDINRAIRLLSIANPGATIVTSEIREAIVDSVDAVLEDLGARYVRHIPEPQRVFRIVPPRAVKPVIGAGTPPMIDEHDLMPTLAFIPPVIRGGLAWPELGNVLAEQVIARLATHQDLRVISRFSTSALAGRDLGAEDISEHLGADYVVSGWLDAGETQCRLYLELVDARSGNILWHEEVTGETGAIGRSEGPFTGDVASRIGKAIRRQEVDRVRTKPLQSLNHHTLMMGAVTLMHRLSYHDFMRAETALHVLVDRAGRQALPLAWLAKWHALRVQQGWSPDPGRDAALGQEATNRALDVDPDCTLALVMDGLVKTNLVRSLDSAQESYDRAIDGCPNEPLAWLLRGTLHAFRGEGAAAVDHAERALALSPLDPHRFYYTSLAATANVSAGHYDKAIELGRQSLRLNRTHTSTFRALGIAHWLKGDGEEARRYGSLLREIEPELTVSQWLALSPAAEYVTGQIWAEGLREMGIPA